MSVKIANLGFGALFLQLALGVSALSTSTFAGSRYRSDPNDTVSFNRGTKDPSSKKRKVESSAPLSPFAPGTHNLSIGVGQVFLLGDLSNQYENAIGPELHYTYGVSDLFSFHSNFGYHSHSNGALSIWNLSGGLRANLMYFDQLVPFATVGMGFYSPTQTLANHATVNTLLFGMQMGTGIDLLISNTVFFGAKLNYNTMFSSMKNASDGTPQKLGGSYLSFMIHAGVTF
jgi:hypothetical protein